MLLSPDTVHIDGLRKRSWLSRGSSIDYHTHTHTHTHAHTHTHTVLTQPIHACGGDTHKVNLLSGLLMAIAGYLTVDGFYPVGSRFDSDSSSDDEDFSVTEVHSVALYAIVHDERQANSFQK